MQVLDSLIDGPLRLRNRREGDELIGMIVRCLRPGEQPEPRTDAQEAVLFAVHILVIDTLGGTVDAIKLSFGQFCTTAVLSWAGSLIEGSVDWAGAAHSWIPILYAGIGSVGIAYTLRVVGQQWVPPTRASLLMSLESFFSAVGGALLLGEVMTPRGYLGCALIFLGTLLAQAPARLPKWPQR